MPKSPSPSVRTAMMLAGRMPVIAEDDSLPAVTHPSQAALPPPPPSRSTKPKLYGRPQKIAHPFHPYPYPTVPPPAYSRSSSRESSRSTVSTRSLLSGGSSAGSSIAGGSGPNSGASTPRSTYKGRSQLLPITTPMGPIENRDEKVLKAKELRRRRWYMVVLFIMIIGLVVGLAAGLTISSRKQTTTTPTNTTVPNIFPAGSFAFNTALADVATNCTSNPATWRCFPYETYNQSLTSGSANGSLATYYWTITPRNSYTYQISSSANPFSPQFANLSMALFDGNSYNERLVFNFTLPKSVVPSEAIAADNKAATCVYADTAFSATLWTRKNSSVGAGSAAADGNVTAVSDGSKWANWPGQIEITQIKSGGGPECKDSDGNAVSVAAGEGQCECRYANFGLGA
ncbi:hypothetical protein K4K48_007880 [Colletotrichum sp. SAR 10_66]|nr:hypothetical protein K4K48_007880 [Colletotrichum sp. SAR 10_66]